MSKPRRKPKSLKSLKSGPHKTLFADHFLDWWHENHSSSDLPEHQLNSARYMFYAGARMLRALMAENFENPVGVEDIFAELMEYDTGIPPRRRLVEAQWKKLERHFPDASMPGEQTKNCHMAFMAGAFTYFALIVMSDLKESNKVSIWFELDEYIPHDLRPN